MSNASQARAMISFVKQIMRVFFSRLTHISKRFGIIYGCDPPAGLVRSYKMGPRHASIFGITIQG
jgi:hypothetical protein